MAQGKYQARRRRRRRINWTGILFWIVLLALVITLIVLLFRGCSPSETPKDTTPPVSTGTVQTPPATDPPVNTVPPTTAAPTVPPTTAAPTVPPTTAPTVPPTVAPTVPPALREQVTALAKSLLGKTYAYGGTGPDSFDTSGLICYCFQQCDITAPRKMSDQYAFGTPVQKDALQPGDVVFFWLETPGEVEYVGIYMGDNVFIAVSSSNNAVEEKQLNDYFAERLLGARRYS